MEKMKFVTACMKFFGRKEGQNLMDFAKEVNALTPTDKAELAPLLSKALAVEVEL